MKIEALRKGIALPIHEPIEILLLDDNNIERELIKELLINIGCNVTSVSTEKECLLRFTYNEYDMVLFDQNISGTDIDSFVTKLAEINLFTPIAMMVSMDIDFYAEKYSRSNIDFLISKPFGYAQLQELVEDVIEFSQRLKGTTPVKN